MSVAKNTFDMSLSCQLRYMKINSSLPVDAVHQSNPSSWLDTPTLCYQKGIYFEMAHQVAPPILLGDLSSPCRRVWRRAIHFLLVAIRFCGSQPLSWLLPLACYWLVWHNDDREATSSSQLRTESFELGPLITPFVLKKMTASPDQRAIYDRAWSGNSQASKIVVLSFLPLLHPRLL